MTKVAGFYCRLYHKYPLNELVGFFALGVIVLTVGAGYSPTNEFIPKTRTKITSPAQGLAVGADGTVFLAKRNGELGAYKYDGSTLIPIAQTSVIGDVTDIALSADNKVFLTNKSEGLRVYQYDGISFNAVAFRGRLDVAANGIGIGKDGTIFVADSAFGISAFRFMNDSLVQCGRFSEYYPAYDIAIGPDGAVFVAYVCIGLFEYENNSFRMIGMTHENHLVTSSIAVNQDSTIFVACHSSLLSYQYHKSAWTEKLNYTAIRYEIVNCVRHVAIGPDGTVFVADSSAVITYAYGVSDKVAGNSNVSSVPSRPFIRSFSNPVVSSVKIGFFLPSSGRATLSIYDHSGRKAAMLINGNFSGGPHCVDFDATGLSSGRYVCRLETGRAAVSRQFILLK
jgi:hypothetical protein